MSHTENKKMGGRPARLSLTSQERRTSTMLAWLFATRMLGLFLLTPVFAVAASSLVGGQDAMRVGFALGAYGLTQAIMQIPLGMASDRFGRRPVIVAGMLLFIVGGVICALSDSVDGIIVGRVLQGLGAVSAAITAWVADATRPEVRTRAMAMVGASIGLSFALSLVLSPVLVGQFGLSGLFWVISALGFVCLLLAAFVVPAAPQAIPVLQSARMGDVLGDKNLLRLNFGVFALHAILMMMFMVVPGLLEHTGGLQTATLWKVYLPVILVSFVFMVPVVFYTETRKCHQAILMKMVLLLAAVLLVMPLALQNFWWLVALLVLFFVAFNVLEALQPSLVSRQAPAEYKGLALGFYNMSQSLGVFGGGVAGGLLAAKQSPQTVLWLGAALAIAWLVLGRGLKTPD
ncbi:MFS transporter [Paenalcaligenes suwonensis]|uniref:MFS transporter n=1 Tax=Paenalcaligenes suwonensis TaxID=1202713 RepID=UPI001F606FA3|nr:MFS transporter [Paenalcaligenes suwonensis]